MRPRLTFRSRFTDRQVVHIMTFESQDWARIQCGQTSPAHGFLELRTGRSGFPPSYRTVKQQPASSRHVLSRPCIRDAMCLVRSIRHARNVVEARNGHQRADCQITAAGWPQIGSSQHSAYAIAITVQNPFSNLLML